MSFFLTAKDLTVSASFPQKLTCLLELRTFIFFLPTGQLVQTIILMLENTVTPADESICLLSVAYSQNSIEQKYTHRFMLKRPISHCENISQTRFCESWVSGADTGILPVGGCTPRSQQQDQKTLKRAKCTDLHSSCVCSCPVPLEVRRTSLGYNILYWYLRKSFLIPL